MIIELRGVNFYNKGAELMLYAMLEQMRRRYPNAKFVLAPLTREDYQYRSRLGLYQKASLYIRGMDIGYIFGKITPKIIRDVFGLVLQEEIDIVLDGSGYAFNDKAGLIPIITARKEFENLKKNNKKAKIILLPQAMGPMKNKKIIKEFKKIVKLVDLIMLRDNKTVDIVNNIIGKIDKIKKFPDFTNLLDGSYDTKYELLKGKICIIPNIRMIDKVSKGHADLYVPLLAKCIDLFIDIGETPFILIHEGNEDIALANRITQMTSSRNIETVIEKDALKIKGIVGASKIVLGSRYHGLVSALSQGIPSIGLGWSHKYNELFNDYRMDRYLLSTDINYMDLKIYIKELISKHTNISSNLLKYSAIEKEKSLSMWNTLFEELKDI